jgi:pimeloyl-ACP methyl ester carboxylesterase
MRPLKFFDLGTVTLSGIEEGEGDLVLLLHGFPAYHKTWDRYLRPLAEAGYRAVAVDLRGYFESSKPAGVGQYAMKRLVHDLATLTSLLGYRTVRVIGHDWGGALAWAFASWQPEMVSHVAVYNCPHPEAMAYHLKRNPRQMLRSWYIGFFQIPRLPEALIRWRAERFIAAAFLARRGTFSAEDLDDYRRAILRPGVLEAGINYYRAAGREILLGPDYPPIPARSCLIWGARDIALGQETTDGMERYFSGAYQRHLFPKHGHWSPNELVDETVPILLDLFRGQ